MSILLTSHIEAADPFLWLESIDHEDVNNWVASRNQATAEDYTQTKNFSNLKQRLTEIYDADDRIPFANVHGEYRYNFWRDAKNPRGVLRRTSRSDYRGATPSWEIVLDLDALAASEDENWVYKGMSVLTDGFDRTLIRLSRGGADAVTVREFDLKTKRFVEKGFVVGEAKTRISWLDRDTLLVGTDTGPASLTESGYPRELREWRRGTRLADAPIVFSGQRNDVSVSVFTDLEPGYELVMAIRARTFYEADYFVRYKDQWLRLDLPKQLDLRIHRGQVFVSPKQPWRRDGQIFPTGSLVYLDLKDLIAGVGSAQLVYQAKPGSSLVQFVPTRNSLIINELHNVTNRLYNAVRKDNSWHLAPLLGNEQIARITVKAIQPHVSDQIETQTTGFLQPLSLAEHSLDSVKPLFEKSMPAKFESHGLTAKQHWVTSADGTQLPYFQIGPKGAKNKPTILYGYGGFEISMAPFYSTTVGTAWLSSGNVYVVANIRGGGEFGPSWHQAALRENRSRAYEDFIAVAEDLIARGVTSTKKLGTTGGSNGGLLVGNMLTMRPDLFGAIVSQVPLLDMRRYNKLLAGASWVAEYGDPDVEEDWAFMKTFSPYHNVSKTVQYPPTLITSSKRDDRVHPGHARKMVAVMESQGHSVSYYENTEGGHAGAANNKQTAYRNALVYEFFRQHLD
ncbi:MAG: prolyl oligopeptidase family serine peptidase [Pseudomonadales bacterium]|nr:prolyl oligopeptidase family serine peptidase [Pseudomonadales bacterium]